MPDKKRQSFYNSVKIAAALWEKIPGMSLELWTAELTGERAMVDSSQYFWVVLCKNHRFHRHQNFFFAHKIPLAETDAFLPPPALNGNLRVRCDDCGQEYSYKPKELVRIQLEYPESFTPHPLFDMSQR